MKTSNLSLLLSSTLLSLFLASPVFGQTLSVTIIGDPIAPVTMPLSVPGNVHPYTICVTAESTDPTTTITYLAQYGLNSNVAFTTPPWNLKGWWIPPAGTTLAYAQWNNANYASGDYYWRGYATFKTVSPPMSPVFTNLHTPPYGPYTTL